eukprot:CAMPEP_0115246836 /NCGR_PEP_ID=MMETSP0270-20121206/41236_1 /TAXON_ID=71861 /ORGANISM="Scrippsiella trochoidea, Strain CCMP3099" /LENGTH=231 /DNA_ID=CAMNT_0002662071 /DNA_START=100 /DNA_END=795 /DNA_ORIENTATION=-
MEANLEGMAPTLDALPARTEVAVVTLLGSLCPVTRGHVQGFLEAREVLLGRSELTPEGLECFGQVVGFISLNSDRHVGQKMMQKGQALLDIRTRQHLVKLAIEEYTWLATERREGESLEQLKQRWPQLRFVHFRMNGADDVANHRKWVMSDAQNRFITMGRPGFTEKVVHGMTTDNVDPRHFILGPELPDISSTAVREALGRRDMEALEQLLHPSVAQWCLSKGAYCEPLK